MKQRATQASGWALTILTVVGGGALADEPKIRGQTLEYDPATGQFIDTPPPVKGTAPGDLQLARRSFGHGRYNQAHRRIKRWLRDYGEDDPQTPQALLLRSETQIARENYYKAHRHLQEIIAGYTGTQSAWRAVHLEFNIAEVFLSGTRRRFLGVRLLDAEDTGLEILDEISGDYPDSALAELAIKAKADYYFKRGDFALAELEFSRLGREFPRSRYTPLAMLRSAQSALAGFPGIEFDDAGLVEAEERFGLFLVQYPIQAEQEGVGQILQQIHTQRAAKELSIGRYYERTKHLDAAVFYYRSTRDNWPDTIAATQATGRLTALGVHPESPAISARPSKAETAS